MNPKDVSVVIVNWNSKDYVQACIASILDQVAEITLEIIVVDSGSFDGCGEMLSTVYPEVRFVQSDENIGFALANNLGVKHARGEVLVFLNPDTETCAGAIQGLYASINKVKVPGVMGCRLLNSDRSLQSSCVQVVPTILNQVFDLEVFQRSFPKCKLWISAAAYEGQAGPIAVEAISGACMMIRRDVFDHVGGFSPDYFMYAEDLDLCWKLRTAGYTNYYIPEFEVVHHGGGSSKHERSHFSEVMIPESISRLLRKSQGYSYSLAYRVALTSAAFVRIVVLGVVFPIGLANGSTSRWRSLLRKWSAILRWGLGLEGWVKRYGQPSVTVTACAE